MASTRRMQLYILVTRSRERERERDRERERERESGTVRGYDLCMCTLQDEVGSCNRLSGDAEYPRQCLR